MYIAQDLLEEISQRLNGVNSVHALQRREDMHHKLRQLPYV